VGHKLIRHRRRQGLGQDLKSPRQPAALCQTTGPPGRDPSSKAETERFKSQLSPEQKKRCCLKSVLTKKILRKSRHSRCLKSQSAGITTKLMKGFVCNAPSVNTRVRKFQKNERGETDLHAVLSCNAYIHLQNMSIPISQVGHKLFRGQESGVKGTGRSRSRCRINKTGY